VARKLGVDPETALRRTIRGFAERYERFNELLEERGLELDDLPEERSARCSAARVRDASAGVDRQVPHDATLLAPNP
jgi:Protein containing tetrapyrrole methyltransferase domain and MazG-like (predicted pyrophosphatase) domain